MLEARVRGWRWPAALVVAAVLAGCAAGPRRPAPVEDRAPAARAQPPVPAPLATETAPVKPAVPVSPDTAGKPGYYTVRPGDTLIRIALDSGQNWRDIARWNNIENPNLIEVGQVLRVIPPVAAEVAVAKPVTPPAPVASAAVPPASAASAPRAAAPPPATAPPPAVASIPPSVASVPPVTPTPAPPGEEDIPWAWPTPPGASVVGAFDEQRNKGLDIAGKPGDPVLASADGRVVYAGAGLRGYGNLIILKHNNTYLSAYAHNQVLLVKEDQTVRKGQKIAEMGSTDADRVKLHFEIRRQGKPVDPARYLPAR
jgi:lipoprotein NlpD